MKSERRGPGDGVYTRGHSSKTMTKGDDERCA